MSNPGLRRSQRQEARGAHHLGGTVNAGSGNGWMRKNDVRTPTYSVEYKTTAAKQFTLKNTELIQAERHAILDGRRMAFGVEMCGRNWMVISEEDFLELKGGSL